MRRDFFLSHMKKEATCQNKEQLYETIS